LTGAITASVESRNGMIKIAAAGALSGAALALILVRRCSVGLGTALRRTRPA
jgi:hypothetical protein